MVVALGPGKFYGSSLPRPRFYTDVKLNDERVDPPPSVMDPLMSWAQEAHWSMGGLSFTRHRLQGRIEGNVERLRKQRETTVFDKLPNHKQTHKSTEKPSAASRSRLGKDNKTTSSGTPSPPPAPVAIKRRRVAVGLADEPAKKSFVRRLGDDFERVARESGMAVGKESEGETVAERTKSKRSAGENKRKRRLVKGGREIGAAVVAAAAVGIRKSPRSKNGSVSS